MPLTVSRGLNAGRNRIRALTAFSSRLITPSRVRITARLLLTANASSRSGNSRVDFIVRQALDVVGAGLYAQHKP